MALFNTSLIGSSFDENLFAENILPFAAYLEPDGLREQITLKKTVIKQCQKSTPQTHEVAKRLLSQIPQRKKWGMQLPEKRWITIEDGKPAGSASRQWRQKGIGMLALLKHFSGRTFSCGTCDAAFKDYSWSEKKHDWLPNLVWCLRWDIDQDDAWRKNDPEAVIAPLKVQRDVLRSIGLPYRVFSTGGRGVQAVIGLPRTVPHMIASLMESVIRAAIDLKMPQDYEGSVDKTALRSIMRLPGGLHAKTGRLGAWIDIEQAKLHPLEHQIKLMGTGFSRQDEPGILTIREFRASLLPISDFMVKQGIRYVDLMNLSDSITILEQCTNSPMAAKLLDLFDQKGSQKASSQAEQSAAAAPQSVTSSTASQKNPSTSPQPAKPSSAVRDWAQSVWDRSFTPGSFYNWISMGGERGILAARILFGEHQAREKLLELAQNVPCGSPSDLNERIRVIESFCSSFHFTASDLSYPKRSEDVATVPLTIDPKITQLAKDAISKLLPPSGKVRWNLELGEKILSIILQGIRDSSIGFYIGSYDSIVRIHNATWSDQKTNRQRVCEMIKRFCEKSSGGPLLYRRKGNNPASEPDRYRCGHGLSNSWLYDDTHQQAHYWLHKVRWGESDEVWNEV